MTTKKILVTTDQTQTLTNKTINAGSNTITNICEDNFKAKTAADEGKVYVISDTGTWTVAKIEQYKRVSTFEGEVGNGKTLYYLDTNYDGSHNLGLYIYNTGTSTFVACTISGNVSIDGITIGMNTAQQLIVKDAGLTVAKFNSDAISTSIPATASAVDTKFTTEKAVATLANGKIPYANATDTFRIGKDSTTGEWYIEED